MKRTLIVLISLSLVATVRAGGDKNIVSSVLKSAMVYRVGAELTHTAKASLSQGNNELVIDNISNRIDINSLQIGSNGNRSEERRVGKECRSGWSQYRY